ncbi:MAG: pyridoxamine 5'-phosphate oxidase family protein [Desulfobulbales bacterium]
MQPQRLEPKIKRLLAGQRLAVLSTSERGHPYASLIAFHAADDLHTVYFATTRATRKYANLMTEPRVAFLIDSRTNQQEDFHQAAAVTILGTSMEMEPAEKKRLSSPFLVKHPYLQEFVEAPTTAFFEVRAELYIYVSRFQEVFEYRIGHASDTVP